MSWTKAEHDAAVKHAMQALEVLLGSLPRQHAPVAVLLVGVDTDVDEGPVVPFFVKAATPFKQRGVVVEAIAAAIKAYCDSGALGMSDRKAGTA
jgi:hypothetical protein